MSWWFGVTAGRVARSSASPPSAFRPVTAFLPFFLSRDYHHRLLPSSLSSWRRYRMDFQRKLRFYRAIVIRAATSGVISIVFRIVRHPVSVWRTNKWGHDDIILHARRSNIKSHLQDSPLAVTYLTFHHVYNGFLSRRQITRYCSGNESK